MKPAFSALDDPRPRNVFGGGVVDMSTFANGGFYPKDSLSVSGDHAIKQPVDMVNHPPHYTSDPSGVECITITRWRNFNIGNAMKYLWRTGLKDDTKQIEDLEKSIFYIKDEIERLKSLQ